MGLRNLFTIPQSLRMRLSAIAIYSIATNAQWISTSLHSYPQNRHLRGAFFVSITITLGFLPPGECPDCPHMPQPPLDTSVCPLCGQGNQCAVVAGQAAGTCWCMSVQFSAAALAAVPDALQGRTCICPACAAWAPQSADLKPPAAPI
ncbi:MAG: cysteine-rich CWC family protein [Acidovorax sp.]